MGTTPINSSSSNEQVASTVNDVIKGFEGLQTTQIFKDDTGTRRVLLGKGADGFYGLKVSKEGKDVYGAVNADLYFNSSQNVFKIVQSGTASVTPAGNTITSATIAHSLGYVPIPLVFLTGGSQIYSLPTYIGSSRSGGAMVFDSWIDYSVDSTNLYITVNNASVGVRPVQQFKYYLLQETAS
jgi:hypothetical protein